MNFKPGFGLVVVLLSASVLIAVAIWIMNPAPVLRDFDGEIAYADVEYQVSLGPRLPGSPAHEQTRQWMRAELKEAGWQVEEQTAEQMGHRLYNIVAKRGAGKPWIIFGAHYDSRFVADHDEDPTLLDQPVPGANDGASGVAVLLEMARTLPADLPGQVWLVFFDLEDQGRIEGWDWILGSTAFAESLQGQPDAVVVIDMIGDADLNVYQENNSDPALTREIWAVASELGYSDQLIAEPKYTILDDHLPFIEKGIPAVDLIDFDYPYWHTTQDTADKVSPKSLEIIGETLSNWLINRTGTANP